MIKLNLTYDQIDSIIQLHHFDINDQIDEKDDQDERVPI